MWWTFRKLGLVGRSQVTGVCLSKEFFLLDSHEVKRPPLPHDIMSYHVAIATVIYPFTESSKDASWNKLFLCLVYSLRCFVPNMGSWVVSRALHGEQPAFQEPSRYLSVSPMLPFLRGQESQVSRWTFPRSLANWQQLDSVPHLTSVCWENPNLPARE